PKMLDPENDEETEAEILNQRRMLLPILPAAPAQQQNDGPTDDILLKDIKQSLEQHRFNKNILFHIWRTTMSVSNENPTILHGDLIKSLYDYVTNELVNYPLIKSSCRLEELLQNSVSSSVETSIEIFKEYLFYSQTKPLFYRLLLHPGVSEEQFEKIMF
ncbi:unnamed protein product, partial [Rotaria sp. Silwood1]